MNSRRGFLRNIGFGIGGIALEQAVPLGRVWSFPKTITLSTSERIDQILIEHWKPHIMRLYERDAVLYAEFMSGKGYIVGSALIRSVDPADNIITLDSIPA